MSDFKPTAEQLKLGGQYIGKYRRAELLVAETADMRPADAAALFMMAAIQVYSQEANTVDGLPKDKKPDILRAMHIADHLTGVLKLLGLVVGALNNPNVLAQVERDYNASRKPD